MDVQTSLPTPHGWSAIRTWGGDEFGRPNSDDPFTYGSPRLRLACIVGTSKQHTASRAEWPCQFAGEFAGEDQFGRPNQAHAGHSSGCEVNLRLIR
ncbi:hypothetical protein SAMN05519104_7887 [Rhizobiales bacterium GAS188]|nr:hypothetical protein SAMN05519104_7887 [Rhizobiales bacterium GAS188]